ncbi:hypothetical protein ACNOYE_04680 [Nannocystaceae bacterium ST9]
MAKIDPKHQGPGFWEKLQPRERVLVMALIGVFFVMGTAVLLFLRHQKLVKVDEEIADLREGLDLVRTFGPGFAQKLADKDEQVSKISSEPLLFSTLIEEAESVAEVKTSNQAEKPPVEIVPGLRKRTVEFDLRSVTLAQLTKFLSALESKEGHVIMTQGLTIRSPSTSEDRLNVDVVLATWERYDEAAEAAEEEG